MPTLDLRTRTSSAIRDVDITEFFDGELPQLAAERSDLAVPGARELGVAPFTLACPAGEWTLSIEADTVVVRRGDGGDDSGRVFLEDEEVRKLVNDLITPMTLVASAGRHVQRGDHGNFLDWWVVLRSLIDGNPAHTVGSVKFRDADGAPLDLERSFTLEDDDEEIAHYLAEAGCLHLSGWFDQSEMDAIDAEMDAAFEHYRPEDGRSWWAETADGTQRAVRLQRFEEHSPTFTGLLRDERFLRIGRLTGDDYEPRSGGEALEKPIGVVKCISDLMWHKDCALGMHSYRCCGLTVGISVTGADEGSGQLAVVPGSHRTLIQPGFYRKAWGLPIRELPTRTGDLTVHCSCTFHMSHAPVAAERRVIYTGFGLASRDEAPLEHEAEVRLVREQAHRKVSQAPGAVATT
ncbi:MAG: phytanoyl-CoA dioxygenase family protein [Acidimicrobiia bacterium]